MDEAPRGPRFLTVSHYFDTHRGGVELVAGRLARELAARGFETAWLATDASPPAAAAGVRTVPVRAGNWLERRFGLPFPIPGPAGLARIVREVRRADAVLLHDGLYLTSVAAFLSARALGRPVTVVQHIGDVPYRSRGLRWLLGAADRLVVRPLLGAADQTVFISETTRAHFERVRFRRPPLLIFNGVDAELHRPAQGADEVRRRRAELGLPAHRPVAVFVGRFVEKKGLHLVRAVAALRPDIAFVLAGWGPIDPVAWGLPNVHVRTGLDGAGVARLHQAGDALLLPSVGEGLPLVIQEALAAGLPVVCGDETAGADREAAPLLAGVDVRSADAARSLAAALDRALALGTPALRDHRRAFAVRRYAWPAAADRHAAVLAGLLRGRAHRLAGAPFESAPA